LSLFNELKRRNVFKVGVAYIVVAWLVAQVLQLIIESFGAPGWVMKTVLVLLAAGVPFALFFAWAFEMTPEGLKKESEVRRDESVTHQTARKLNLVVILLLVAAIALFSVDRLTTHGPPAQPTQVIEVGVESVPVVAVLPLKAMSSGEEGSFLASGLHDDLLTKLAKLRVFKVISRTSVMEYADTNKNMRQIGEELGAGYILEGGLQAIGGRVSINAQLINAKTDEHMWAETFNHELTTANLFDVQAEIATAIANALRATLSPGEALLLAKVPTENLDAYRAYLHGLKHSEILSLPAMMAAIDDFSEAVALDPDFVEAWARLGRAQIRRYWEEGGEYDADPDESLIQSARQSLDMAQHLAPDNVEVLLSEAYFYYYGYRDYSAALIELKKAEAIAPYDHMVIASRGFLLRRLGRLDEAADALLSAREYNLAHLGHIREATTTLLNAGRCEEARQLATEGLARYPDASGILMVASRTALVCDGDLETAHRLVSSVVVTTFYEFQNKLDMLLNTKDLDAAIELALAAQLQFADDRLMQLFIANSLTALYQLTGAQEQAEVSRSHAGDLAVDLENGGSFALRQLALEAALRGDSERAVILGNRGLETFPMDAYMKPVFQYRLLTIFVLTGADKVAWQAFQDWLRVALYAELQEIRYDPLLKPLRTDPRFEAAHVAALQRYER
jgi:TolB-like protein